MAITCINFHEIDFGNDDGFYLVLFTPELAEVVLDTRNYERQRPIKQKVEQYAADMRNGKWRLTKSDPILFTKQGKLINGQHRLSAVKMSGISQMFYVATGADETEFQVIDTGISRTAADGLKGLVRNANGVAALSRRMLNIMRGYAIDSHAGVKKVVTNADVQEYALARDAHLQDLFNNGKHLKNSLHVNGFGNYAYGVSLWLLMVKNEIVANNYIEAFCLGDPSMITTREAIFRKALSKDSKSGQWLVETFLQSFNGYLRGVPTKSFNKGPSVFKSYVEIARNTDGWWSE